MPLPIGFSAMDALQPQQAQNQGVGRPGAASTPQEAVQIRSLRVPKVLPSNAPVARQLLTSAGSATPGMSGLTSLVQELLRAFQAQPAQNGMQTMPTFPSAAPQPTGPTFEGHIDSPVPTQQTPGPSAAPDLTAAVQGGGSDTPLSIAPPFTFDEPTPTANGYQGNPFQNQLPNRGGLNIYDRPAPSYAFPSVQFVDNETAPSAAPFNFNA